MQRYYGDLWHATRDTIVAAAHGIMTRRGYSVASVEQLTTGLWVSVTLTNGDRVNLGEAEIHRYVWSHQPSNLAERNLNTADFWGGVSERLRRSADRWVKQAQTAIKARDLEYAQKALNNAERLLVLADQAAARQETALLEAKFVQS